MPSLSPKAMPQQGIVTAATSSRPIPETMSAADRRPLIIEMFGVPGAGKSTLVNAVIEGGHQRARRELTAAWNRLPYLQKTAFLLRALSNLGCVSAATSFARRSRLTSADSLVRLFRLIAKTQWMRSQSGVLLLDESFLQEIWSVCVSSGRSDPDPVTLARLIRCLYTGLEAQVVFVEADEAMAAQRISDRSHGNSRLDGIAVDEVEARLSSSARLPHAIIAAAMTAGLPVERLDATDPIDSNADRLRTLLITKSGGQDRD